MIVLFEILDSFKSDDMDTNTPSGDTGKNWRRIAWAFLKLVGSDKTLNIGKKIRLQLYYTQQQYRFNLIDSLVPEVYNLYKNGPKIKYPSSLHVTIRPIHPAKRFYLGIGSSYMIDEEENMIVASSVDLKKMSEDQLDGNTDNDGVGADTLIDDPARQKKKTVIWSRLPGQACNVPNELALSLTSTKYGCYSVKFSTSGSYLACACVDEDNGHPIIIYDIPEGNFCAIFLGHFGIVYELAWSNLDRYLLTASHDATVRFVSTFKRIPSLTVI